MSQLTNPLEVLKTLSDDTSLLIKKPRIRFRSLKPKCQGHGRSLNQRRLHSHLQPCPCRMQRRQNWAGRKNIQRKNRGHRPIQ
jgi:hypothetical protein